MEKKNEIKTEETAYINTEELRDVLASEEKENAKKEGFFKKLFKKKNKKKNG